MPIGETMEWMRTGDSGGITWKSDPICRPARRAPENPQLDARRVRETGGNDRADNQRRADRKPEALVWPRRTLVRRTRPEGARARRVPGCHGYRRVACASCGNRGPARAEAATVEWSSGDANGTPPVVSPRCVTTHRDHHLPARASVLRARRPSPVPQRSIWRMPSTQWSGRPCPSGELRTLVARDQAGKTRRRRTSARCHALIVGPSG